MQNGACVLSICYRKLWISTKIADPEHYISTD